MKMTMDEYRKIYPEGTVRYRPIGNSGVTEKRVNGKWVTILKKRSEYKVPEKTPIGKSGPRPELRELVYGVGINDIMIPQFSTSKIARTWRGIIRRSGQRDPNMKNYESYKDCTLDPRWYKLSAFKEWIEQWDDHDNKEIDKDILIPGNLEYGPDTCLMVRPVINLWFKPNATGGELPRGVTWNSYWKKGGNSPYPYRAQITPIGGKRTGLGLFATIEEASAVFQSARKKELKVLMESETDVRVRNAIMNYL